MPRNDTYRFQWQSKLGDLPDPSDNQTSVKSPAIMAHTISWELNLVHLDDSRQP